MMGIHDDVEKMDTEPKKHKKIKKAKKQNKQFKVDGTKRKIK